MRSICAKIPMSMKTIAAALFLRIFTEKQQVDRLLRKSKEQI
jgi:hypothetical protein